MRNAWSVFSRLIRETSKLAECPENVPEEQVGIFVNGSSRVGAVELEPEENSDTDDLLVEEIDDHVRVAEVGPVAVNEEQTFEEAELTHRVIRGIDGLKSFFSGYSYSDIGCLNHRDVVRSISDRETHRTETILDETNDESFLKRRGTAADDSFAASCEFEEEIFGVKFTESVTKGGSIDNESVTSRSLSVIISDNVRDSRGTSCGSSKTVRAM